MFDPVAHRIALHRLGEDELGPVVELEGEQGVGLLQCEHQLVGRKRQVLGGLTMPVDDNGDLLVAAEPTRGAFTELGAALGGDSDLWHDLTPDGGRYLAVSWRGRPAVVAALAHTAPAPRRSRVPASP